jgi:signal transduction histidine kinase
MGVAVSIADTGVGIPAEHLSRIFDPFFSTKGVGKGTGLGLAITRRILEDHGGSIEVSSEVGRGTTFTIWLPAAEGAHA